MEDSCIVCADTLEYCSYGKCGHKEMCHRCSARLRFLGEDKTCPLCKEEIEVAVVTRFMGEQTNLLPPEDLDQLAALKKRTQRYQYLPSISTYYDEYETFQDIRELCSLQHPVLDMYEGEEDIPRFRALRDLKNFVKDNFKLHFCELCLKNRKAFVCEQVLYPKRKLEMHYKEGDKEGPLAETGFAGHPMCTYCRNRFYNEDMHYQHMERDHYHCDICRRLDPRKYVYYNKYDDLEEHYKAQHFLCPIQECLDKKFIVFQTEPELKRHLAQNHAEQLGMGKTDRRAAMTIPVEFNFGGSNRRGQGQGQNQSQNGGVEVSFGQGRGMGHGGHSRNNVSYDRSRNAQDRAQLREAMRLSMQDGGGDDNNIDFENSDEAFPALGIADDVRGLGTWTRSGNSSTASLTDQDFPSLPGQSRNAKKHARQKNRRQEEQQKFQQQSQQPQHSQQQRSSSNNFAQQSAQSEAFPALPSSAVGSSATHNQEWKNARSTSNGNVQGNKTSSNVQKKTTPQNSVQSSQQAPSEKDFPGLGGKKGGQKKAALNSQWGTKPTVASKPNQVRVLKPAQPQPVSPEEAFPSLGQAQEKQKVKFTRQPPSRPSNSGSSSTYSHVLKQDVKLSKNMQFLNEDLVGRIQERLDSDLIEFFRIESNDFLSHEIDASEFHAKLSVLGVVDLVPRFAAMLHNTQLRETLLDCHEQLPCMVDQWNELSEDSKYRIGSPEQLLQESEVSRRVHAWQCPECRMVNGSNDLTCEDCGLKQTVARSMIIAAEGVKPRSSRPVSGGPRAHISGQNAWKKPSVGYSAPVSKSQQRQGNSMAQKLAVVKNQLENPQRR